MKQVSAETAGMKRAVGYSYRVPFPQYVEGFVVHFAGGSRLTEQYIENRGGILGDAEDSNTPASDGSCQDVPPRIYTLRPIG